MIWVAHLGLGKFDFIWVAHLGLGTFDLIWVAHLGPDKFFESSATTL